MISRFSNWWSPSRTPESGPILLVQRRVYILPTRYGIMFAMMLMIMLLGAINYSLSLGFVLTFLLLALAFNTMLYTYRNLASLSVTAARTPAVFAGEAAVFTLNLSNPSAIARFAIGISRERRASAGSTHVDVPAQMAATISISIPSERRGLLRAGRLTLFTQFPLGLYHAWSYVHPDLACLVYPQPAPAGYPLPPAESADGSGASHGAGHEDFAGLRPYHSGDSPRHVAWKAVARGQGMFTKQFSGQAAHEVWLAWEQLPPRMGIEEKIAVLARWVLDAHAQQLSYGLRLPGSELPLASGDAQRERCLQALALFEYPQAS